MLQDCIGGNFVIELSVLDPIWLLLVKDLVAMLLLDPSGL